MVLINNFNLADGSEWTADLANLAFDPVFNDQTQFLNNHPRLTDDSLSNIAGNVKPRLIAIEDSLRLTQGLGTVVTWAAGQVALPDGSVVNTSSGSNTLPNDGTYFFWVNAQGVVAIGTVPPAIRLMLGRVVTSGGNITLFENRRTLSVRPVLPAASATKIFGGASVTDFVPVNNATYSDGYYYVRDFIVPNGMTIFINGYAKIFCSGTVNIQGVITVAAPTNGATPFSTSVLAVNIGGYSGSGLGSGSGSSTVGGNAYSYAASSLGSGGGGGYVNGTPGSVASSSTGGNGGGCLWIEAAGGIIVGATANIAANGTNGAPGVVASGTLASGAGGGSGGLVYLSSLSNITINTGAFIRSNGGNGSNAANVGVGSTALGGGGGGGGWVVLAAPNVFNGTAIQVNGGAAGANAGSGGSIGGGSGGGFGGTGGNAGGASPQPGTAGRILQLNFSPIGV
jgi:hypothetical protein